MTTHHTTESVELLAWSVSCVDPTKTTRKHVATTLRDLASERDALRARLDEAARALESVLAGRPVRNADEIISGTRALLNGGGNG